MTLLFWLALAVIFYSYLGYGLLMKFASYVREFLGRTRPPLTSTFTPPVTLVVAAYNERDVIDHKVANCRSLDYPATKLRLLFVTDGSDDGTDRAVAIYPDVMLLHQPQRQGKTAAVNRAMSIVGTPLTVFSDANTMLNRDAIRNLVRHFAAPEVGCVAGEKRVLASDLEMAPGAGESLYWRYESRVKRWEAAVGSVMGAAGELYAVRTELYAQLPNDTLLDDFVASFRIAMQGYRLAYAPDAYAMEAASLSIEEEWKRKVRNCAGGLQAVRRLWPLLNPFQYGFLSWQYISHRVLRWTVTPLALVYLLPANAYLAVTQGGAYALFLWGQLLFYALALVGWRLAARRIRWKPFFVPYYFTMMNLAVFAGMVRYLQGTQSVLWEKPRRSA